MINYCCGFKRQLFLFGFVFQCGVSNILPYKKQVSKERLKGCVDSLTNYSRTSVFRTRLIRIPRCFELIALSLHLKSTPLFRTCQKQSTYIRAQLETYCILFELESHALNVSLQEIPAVLFIHSRSTKGLEKTKTTEHSEIFQRDRVY